MSSHYGVVKMIRSGTQKVNKLFSRVFLFYFPSVHSNLVQQRPFYNSVWKNQDVKTRRENIVRFLLTKLEAILKGRRAR